MPYKDPAAKRARRMIREAHKRKTDRKRGVLRLSNGFAYVNPNDLPDATEYSPRVMRVCR